MYMPKCLSFNPIQCNPIKRQQHSDEQAVWFSGLFIFSLIVQTYPSHTVLFQKPEERPTFQSILGHILDLGNEDP